MSLFIPYNYRNLSSLSCIPAATKNLQLKPHFFLYMDGHKIAASFSSLDVLQNIEKGLYGCFVSHKRILSVERIYNIQSLIIVSSQTSGFVYDRPQSYSFIAMYVIHVMQKRNTTFCILKLQQTKYLFCHISIQSTRKKQQTQRRCSCL